MDFLFRKVSKEEKEEIKKQAKAVMDNFSKKLSKIDKKIGESLIERDEGEREEKKEGECDGSFREIMFENAPKKNKDFIIGERKRW